MVKQKNIAKQNTTIMNTLSTIKKESVDMATDLFILLKNQTRLLL
jgi:hypothetical protein